MGEQHKSIGPKVSAVQQILNLQKKIANLPEYRTTTQTTSDNSSPLMAPRYTYKVRECISEELATAHPYLRLELPLFQ